MTREQQIRNREAGAKRGPWKVGIRKDNPTGIGFHQRVLSETIVTEPDGYPKPAMTMWVHGNDGQQEDALATAEFIAHAREDIPWLLAKIDRLKKKRGKR